MRKRRFDAQASGARARQMTAITVQRAKRARRQLVVLVPLVVVVVLAYRYRVDLFGVDTPARLAVAGVMVILGWALARDVGRAAAPLFFRRMEPGAAGTIGFLIRLTFLAAAVLVALRLAGLEPRTLAVGGAITAVVFGLAAQQTLANLIAGVVLISARPFRVGERVRLQAGNLAGQLEGTVSSLGLLYTTFAQGEDVIMVPNTTVLSSAVVPLREPASVDLRARLRPDVQPTAVQALLARAVSTPVRGEPHIGLEEVDSEEVIMRIAATPEDERDGPRLADEILAAISSLTREPTGATSEYGIVTSARDRDGARDRDYAGDG